MIFTPSTTVYLCGVPLESDMKNQLTFDSQAAQSAYFLSKVKRTYSNFTYQRKDNILRVPANFEDLYNCNYVMYQNSNFGNKWFYAFIVGREYVNPNCTHLTLKTDPFQTYMFDVTYYNSFVVREHVADDTPFTHTLPENLATGDIIIYNEERATPFDLSAVSDSDFSAHYWACVVSSYVFGAVQQMTPNVIGGVPSSCYYYAMELTDLNEFIDILTQANATDTIIACYPVIKSAVNVYTIQGAFSSGGNLYAVYDKNSDIYRGIVVSRSQLANGVTPKNNKCLCYPYNYLTLHNSNGSKIDLKIENFYNIRYSNENIATLHTYYSPSMDCALSVAPKFYEYSGTGDIDVNAVNFDYAVDFNNFPQIAFKTDEFSIYLATHSNSLKMNKLKSDVSILQGVANTVTSGNVNSLFNAEMGAMSYRATLTDTLGRLHSKTHGQPSGGIELRSKSAGIRIAKKSVTPEYLTYIDNYFSMYGYNVSIVKNPQNSMKTRPNWNYIETRDINIAGDIPDDDLNNLKSMFNSGVTLWHNAATFGDYSQNNAPT